MKVRLNLATTPLANNRRFVLGAGLLGTAALALLVVLSVYSYRSWRANRAVRNEVSGLHAEMRALRDERRELEVIGDRAVVIDHAGMVEDDGVLHTHRSGRCTPIILASSPDRAIAPQNLHGELDG